MNETILKNHPNLDPNQSHSLDLFQFRLMIKAIIIVFPRDLNHFLNQRLKLSGKKKMMKKREVAVTTVIT